MQNKYDLILSRTSIRRFRDTQLSENQLNEIQSLKDNISGLNCDNNFQCQIFNYFDESENSKALGVFGRIFSAPYFMAPTIIGDSASVIDLGFRSQKIVLEMWYRGIGSCYIGCVHNSRRIIDFLNLIENARIIACIVFGHPAEDQSKYLYQKVSQIFTRSKSRLEISELFLDQSAAKNLSQSVLLKKIVEAGRFAPSATNTQPWRFHIEGENLIVYTKRKKLGKIYDINQAYIMHDIGICMANMSMAATALGVELKWQMIYPDQKSVNKNLVPIARFPIDELMD